MKNKIFFLCILFALGLVILQGCGKKTWPTANSTQELFQWKSVSFELRENCLDISASLKGNIDNLQKIVLLLEESEKLCSDCPFRANVIKTLYSDYSEKNTESSFQFDYCQLEKDKEYRFRLKGINKYSNLQNPKTEVFTLQ